MLNVQHPKTKYQSEQVQTDVREGVSLSFSVWILFCRFLYWSLNPIYIKMFGFFLLALVWLLPVWPRSVSSSVSSLHLLPVSTVLVWVWYTKTEKTGQVEKEDGWMSWCVLLTCFQLITSLRPQVYDYYYYYFNHRLNNNTCACRVAVLAGAASPPPPAPPAMFPHHKYFSIKNAERAVQLPW